MSGKANVALKLVERYCADDMVGLAVEYVVRRDFLKTYGAHSCDIETEFKNASVGAFAFFFRSRRTTGAVQQAKPRRRNGDHP